MPCCSPRADVWVCACPRLAIDSDRSLQVTTNRELDELLAARLSRSAISPSHGETESSSALERRRLAAVSSRVCALGMTGPWGYPLVPGGQAAGAREQR